jgi:hypothetical protein
MAFLHLVRLSALMQITSGHPQVAIGLIDGPVALEHPDLAEHIIREVPGRQGAACSASESAACVHGTWVAGVLVSKRGSAAPSICPGCTLLVRPIFSENARGAERRNSEMPQATPDDVAEAMLDCVNAGSRVINLSAAVAKPSTQGEGKLESALDYAATRGVLVVAAAWNQALLGGSAITRHPWVIPVVGFDWQGRPTPESNLGRSIGRHGLRAWIQHPEPRIARRDLIIQRHQCGCAFCDGSDRAVVVRVSCGELRASEVGADAARRAPTQQRSATASGRLGGVSALGCS